MMQVPSCWDMSKAGLHKLWNPAGMGAPPRTVGRRWFLAPPCKNDQNLREVAGQNKARFSNFSNKRNQWWNNIATLNNAHPACQLDMKETPPFTSFPIQYWELFLWIIIEIKEKVKVPSTPSSFFANRARNLVLRDLSIYEIAHSCPKFHPCCCWWWWRLWWSC